MTIPLDLLETEGWPMIRRKIAEERESRVNGLLHVTPGALIAEQAFIAALDWVVEQATPKPDEEEESIYDDC